MSRWRCDTSFVSNKYQNLDINLSCFQNVSRFFRASSFIQCQGVIWKKVCMQISGYHKGISEFFSVRIHLQKSDFVVLNRHILLSVVSECWSTEYGTISSCIWKVSHPNEMEVRGEGIITSWWQLWIFWRSRNDRV